MEIIEQTLSAKLKIAISSIYKNSDHFIKAFLKEGGVIE